MITISTQDPASVGNVFATAARILEDGIEEYTGPISSTIVGPLPLFCNLDKVEALFEAGGKFFERFYPHQSGQFDIDAPQE